MVDGFYEMRWAEMVDDEKRWMRWYFTILSLFLFRIGL